MVKDKNRSSPGDFGEIEEALRIYSIKLGEELEEKKRECRAAEEEALLRLSEMEAETLKQVKEEWSAREEALALLSEEMDREVMSLKDRLSEQAEKNEMLGALVDEAFAMLLGEAKP